MRRLAIFLAVLFLLFSILSAEEVLDRVKEGIALYNAAARDGEKTDAALAYYEELAKDYPEDPFVKAYLGSVYTLKARDVASPLSKMKWVQKANKSFDTAVERLPENIFLRMERGQNSLYLPSFLGRFKVAEKDFTFLAGRMEAMSDAEIVNTMGALLLKRPEDTEKTFALRIRQFCYYYAGHVALERKEKKKAENYWKRALQLGPETKNGQAARERIEKLHESK